MPRAPRSAYKISARAAHVGFDWTDMAALRINCTRKTRDLFEVAKREFPSRPGRRASRYCRIRKAYSYRRAARTHSKAKVATYFFFCPSQHRALSRHRSRIAPRNPTAKIQAPLSGWKEQLRSLETAAANRPRLTSSSRLWQAGQTTGDPSPVKPDCWSCESARARMNSAPASCAEEVGTSRH